MPYKKALIIFLLFCEITLPVFSQNLDYKPETSELFYNNNPLPTWLDTVIDYDNTDLQYQFLRQFSNTYNIVGWKIIDLKINMPDLFDKGTFALTDKQIEEGWAYSYAQKPSNLPKGWLYAPTYNLFFNTEGIKKLNLFFINYLYTIKPIHSSAISPIMVNKFFRIIIPPNNKIANISVNFPDNIVLAYKTIKHAPGERILIFYTNKAPEKEKKSQNLTINIQYINGKKDKILYKIKVIPKKL